jgi:hypothetical protein
MQDPEKISAQAPLFIKIGYDLENILQQYILPHPQKLEFAHGIPHILNRIRGRR